MRSSAVLPKDGQNADFILSGGQIVTMTDDQPFVDALAVKDGVIVATALGTTLDGLRGPGTLMVDLKGRVVIPGLQDSHLHISALGWELSNAAELSLAKTRADVLQAVGEVARRVHSSDDWIVGNRWTEVKYENGMVDRWQLDELTRRNPVYLLAANGGLCVNTAVFEMMGIRDNDPSTWPDWWLEDPEDFTAWDTIGRALRTIETKDGDVFEREIPTGIVRYAHGGSPASQLITQHPPELTAEQRLTSIRDAAKALLRLGVTSFVQASGGGAAIWEAYRRGWLHPLRVANIYDNSFRDEGPSLIQKTLADRTDGGHLDDERHIKAGGVKFFADGGVLSRSAWLSRSYADSPTQINRNYGRAVVPDNEARLHQYRAAAEKGWSLHTHAAGDRAMRQTVDVYAELRSEMLRRDPAADLRWSIEHCYLPLEPETRTTEDMARLKIIASIQPAWTHLYGADFMMNLGSERVARSIPARSLISAGVTVASGSDYHASHYDPWLGLYALVTREVLGTRLVVGPDERLTILEALRTYTLNGAYLTHNEATRGSLEVGKYADLVVLRCGDIEELQREPSRLLQKELVECTLVAGEVAFKSLESDLAL